MTSEEQEAIAAAAITKVGEGFDNIGKAFMLFAQSAKLLVDSFIAEERRR